MPQALDAHTAPLTMRRAMAFLATMAVMAVASLAGAESGPSAVVVVADPSRVPASAGVAEALTDALRRTGVPVLSDPGEAFALFSAPFAPRGPERLAELSSALVAARDSTDLGRVVTIALAILQEAGEGASADLEANGWARGLAISAACFEGVEALLDLKRPHDWDTLVAACSAQPWLVRTDQSVPPSIRRALLAPLRSYALRCVFRSTWALVPA